MRLEEDEDVGRIVSVMRPPGLFPRSVACKPAGGSTGALKHAGMRFSCEGACLILVPSLESRYSVEVVNCFAGSRHGYRGSGSVWKPVSACFEWSGNAGMCSESELDALENNLGCAVMGLVLVSVRVSRARVPT